MPEALDVDEEELVDNADAEELDVAEGDAKLLALEEDDPLSEDVEEPLLELEAVAALDIVPVGDEDAEPDAESVDKEVPVPLAVPVLVAELVEDEDELGVESPLRVDEDDEVDVGDGSAVRVDVELDVEDDEPVEEDNEV